eukprot:jgi/Orpsp1_1/1187886/evm.model.d7180000060932.1
MGWLFKSEEEKLLDAIESSDIENVKLILENSVDYNIVLDINKKNSNGIYPLLLAIDSNNIEIVKLLIDYANQFNIILEYDKNEIENNPEIIKLIEKYEKEKEK